MDGNGRPASVNRASPCPIRWHLLFDPGCARPSPGRFCATGWNWRYHRRDRHGGSSDRGKTSVFGYGVTDLEFLWLHRHYFCRVWRTSLRTARLAINGRFAPITAKLASDLFCSVNYFIARFDLCSIDKNGQDRANKFMKRVTGIGGVFFKANDPSKLCEWYRAHLGIE